MLRAEFISATVPSEAQPGKSILCFVFLRNAGDEEGWLIASVHWLIGETWEEVWGTWKWVFPGDAYGWSIDVIMPDQDIDVYFEPGHHDPNLNAYVAGARQGPFHVTLIEPIIKKGPIPLIEQFWPVKEAFAGSEVVYRANIRNVGDQPGWFRLRESRQGVNYVAGSWTWFVEIPVGGIQTLSGTFLMPDFNITVTLQAEWWDEPNQRWKDGGDPVSYSIAVIRDPWPAVGMPQRFWDFLSGSLCNVFEGAWAKVEIWGVGLNIPLWDFTPGIYARDAIQWTIDEVNKILGGLGEISVKLQEAWDWAWGASQAVDDWLTGAESWFNTQVSNWWSAALPSVQAAFTAALDNLKDALGDRITTLEGVVTSLQNLEFDFSSIWQELEERVRAIPFISFTLDAVTTITRLGVEVLDELPDFFSDPPGWIFDKIDDWLNESTE